MNYNGYKFDFACDPIITDNDPPQDKGEDNSDEIEYNASRERY